MSTEPGRWQAAVITFLAQANSERAFILEINDSLLDNAGPGRDRRRRNENGGGGGGGGENIVRLQEEGEAAERPDSESRANGALDG